MFILTDTAMDCSRGYCKILIAILTVVLLALNVFSKFHEIHGISSFSFVSDDDNPEV